MARLNNRNPNEEFWKNKNVLLTGHTGFKGSWLSIWLNSLGANVAGLSLSPITSPSLFTVANVENLLAHNVVDIRDLDGVVQVFEGCRPEIVIHMAAQPLVRQSYDDPIETYETNIMGTIHTLEAARRVGTVKAIVNVTTDKCYENREWHWGYRETEAMGGYDPYSSSKGCVELISQAYRRSFLEDEGIAMGTARAGNVIGGGDWSDGRLIPDVLRGLRESGTVELRNPNAVRPWQHVLEPINAYMLLAERLFCSGKEFAEGWNFGPYDSDILTVQEVAESLGACWGTSPKIQYQPGPHPHEANILKLDTSKARDRLKWAPRWSTGLALEKIVEWERDYLSQKDIHETCRKQISDFQKTEASAKNVTVNL